MALNPHSLLLAAAFVLFLAVNPPAAHSRTLKSKPQTTFASLDEVKRYLEAYGYLEPSEYPNGATGDTLTVESSLEFPLKTYQERNHLKATGKLDSETVARMRTPRCGMPDIVRKPAKGAGAHNSSNPGKFHVVAHYTFFQAMNPWTKRQLTYTFTSTIPSVSLGDLRAICARAFGRWAAVTSFQFQESAEGEEADIKIGFYTGDHGDGRPFDGPGGVWAHTAAPQVGRLHFDGSENWSTSTPTMEQTDLESITVHEIGHSLGLGHTDDTNAIMYPYINPGVVKRELQQDDIDGIQALYPSK